MDVWAEHVTKRGVMNLQEKSALQPPQASASFLLCQSTWHYPLSIVLLTVLLLKQYLVNFFHLNTILKANHLLLCKQIYVVTNI